MIGIPEFTSPEMYRAVFEKDSLFQRDGLNIIDIKYEISIFKRYCLEIPYSRLFTVNKAFTTDYF